MHLVGTLTRFDQLSPLLSFDVLLGRPKTGDGLGQPRRYVHRRQIKKYDRGKTLENGAGLARGGGTRSGGTNRGTWGLYRSEASPRNSFSFTPSSGASMSFFMPCARKPEQTNHEKRGAGLHALSTTGLQTSSAHTLPHVASTDAAAVRCKRFTAVAYVASNLSGVSWSAYSCNVE